MLNTNYNVNISFTAEELNFEPVTREILMQDKVFFKILKKQQKDLEVLKKKFQKERAMMQRQHCMIIDKLVASHDKEKTSHEKTLEKKIKKKGYIVKLSLISST